MSYLEELRRELDRAGVRGHRQRRILLEVGDHLACDPQADLGPASQVAREFADQLGTLRAQRAGLGVFAGLSVAGGLLLAVFVVQKTSAGSFPRLHPASRPLADLALSLVAIGAQLAFVSGVLAALRTFRHRHQTTIPRSEAIVIARRAWVGLVSGLASMAGLALLATEYRRALPSSWVSLALWSAAAGAWALIAVTPLLVSARAIRPLKEGRAGDLFDDLGPLVPPILQGRAWLLALLVAGGVAVLVTLGGAAGSDPYDGAARGLLDGLACLAGFALLGRYLGLRARPDA